MNTLVAELRGYNHKNSVERALGQDWPGFVDVIAAYLEYVKSVHPGVNSSIEDMLAWFYNLKEFMGYNNSPLSNWTGLILTRLEGYSIQSSTLSREPSLSP